MEDIENNLGIRTCPMNWPIGTHGQYIGIYERATDAVHLFAKSEDHGQKKIDIVTGKRTDSDIQALIGEENYAQLEEDIELLDIAGDPFDADRVAAGELSPMYFGSAMTNFGVQPFLENFMTLAPAPGTRKTNEGSISPDNDDFSAFVFKIQANMDPKHHDRIAFMRICSGTFTKGMSVLHRQSGKTIRLAQPQQFLATERTIVENAYPGDIIGIFDTGILGVGDTLCHEKRPITFADFPVFPPELFARVAPKDSLKRKQFLKGMTQLAQEGAVQIYTQGEGRESFIIGAVGQLQWEVLQYRLQNEYNVTIELTPLPYSVARWVLNTSPDKLTGLGTSMIVQDHKNRPVILLANEWQTNWLLERNPDAEFVDSPPVITDTEE